MKAYSPRKMNAIAALAVMLCAGAVLRWSDASARAGAGRRRKLSAPVR
jgi:hypothetical protein